MNPDFQTVDPASTLEVWAPRWLANGRAGFASMLEAIRSARLCIQLETYTCTDCSITRSFRDALVEACKRGVRVRVLVDAFGSLELEGSFWAPVVEAGGEFRWFNPVALKRIAYRNHRKLLVCDRHRAFIGGFNLAEEYDGDGVTSGWRDLGLELQGGIVSELADSFELMFQKAETRHSLWKKLRLANSETVTQGRQWKLLLNIPSFLRRTIKQTLVADLQSARSVRIMAAYFLPTWRIRHELLKLARSGTRVQLLLAGKSDVRLAQLAGRRLYDVFMKAGVEIWEYQPQVLHAKLVVIDDVVYAGSCNLDLRSLNFNYELMVRVEDSKLAAQARQMFDGDLAHAKRINSATWRHQRGLLTKLQERVSHFLLARLDPFVARWQLRLLR